MYIITPFFLSVSRSALFVCVCVCVSFVTVVALYDQLTICGAFELKNNKQKNREKNRERERSKEKKLRNSGSIQFLIKINQNKRHLIVNERGLEV